MLIKNLRRQFGQLLVLTISLASLAVLFLGYGHPASLAASPAMAGSPTPRATPLVECIIGLVLLLTAVGLSALVRRARVKKKG